MEPTEDPLPPWRKWLFRLAALGLVPLLLLAVLEIGLRAAGFGYSTHFFRKATIGGEECLIENGSFGLRFFPPAVARMPEPFVMKGAKPKGTIRVFILGESAAQGDPRSWYGAGRYLEILLRERYPGQKFEIINTAITAINSHVILPIARECARENGDLWIVYMGNNEMVGPFGAATIFGRQAPSRTVVQLSLAAQRMRLGQMFVDLSRKLKSRSGKLETWEGMEMFLKNEVPPNDPRKEVVYRSFRENLNDILEAGLGSGAKIVLSTIAVNMKDCPPFSSLSSGTLPPGDQAAVAKLSADGSAAEGQQNYTEAVHCFEKAAALFPKSAELQFQLGACLLHVTNTTPARLHLQQSLDCDALPFRADSRINDLIVEAATRFAGPGLALCDARTVLDAKSPGGICGSEFFYEHVHFTDDGNYQLARAWAAEVERVMPGLAPQDGWISQERCERLLGLTDWNRVSIVEEMINRVKAPPLSGQSNNARRTERFERRAAELRERLARIDPAKGREAYAEALKQAPDDYRLRQGYAEFLEAVNDPQQAAQEQQKVCSLVPHFYFAHYKLGMLLKQQGQFPEALRAFCRAAELNPTQGEVRLQLGAVYAIQNEQQKALDEFQRARQLKLEDPRLYLFSGEALWKLNRRAEAIEDLRTAVRLNPEYAEARYRLGEKLALDGQIEAAVKEFQQVIQQKPKHVKAHANLAVALYKLGRAEEAVREFDETLRLDPQNRQALDFKQRARPPR